jgi:hypothetical protein
MTYTWLDKDEQEEGETTKKDDGLKDIFKYIRMSVYTYKLIGVCVYEHIYI